MTRDTDSVAVVTGGAQGIGEGIAGRLAIQGADVAIADINHETARATADEIAAEHDVGTLAVDCDVTDEPAVEGLIETVADTFGPVDTFVNNAGGAMGFARTWELDVAEWRATVDLSLHGVFLGTKHAVRHMLETPSGGSIVNVASINREAATDGMAPYCAAKAGVSQLTKVVAAEAGRHGIRVNAVAPGATRTPLTQESGLVEGAMGEAFRERTPLGRIGEPDDIADAVAFLVSEEARWVTGETLRVDGGLHIRGVQNYYDTLQAMFEE